MESLEDNRTATGRPVAVDRMAFKRLATIFALASSLAWTMSPTDARAQDNGAAKLQELTKTSVYSTLISNAFARMPPAVFQRCPTLVSNGSSVTVGMPLSFGADGYPNAGSWRQTFPVSGCGNDTVLNLYFSVGADEKINTVVGVPGMSHANLTLQRDAVRYANIGAALVMKSCKAFDVKTTKFEGYGLKKPEMPDPGPGAPGRPWWETWTMVGCGGSVDVPMDFVPDASGTRIIQPGSIAAQ